MCSKSGNYKAALTNLGAYNYSEIELAGVSSSELETKGN